MEIDIITRNFFKLMRSGALNEYVELEPMSAFKWNRLVEIIDLQDVIRVASRGIKNLQFDKKFNMPAVLRERVHAEAAKRQAQEISLEMNNPILKKKLTKIHLLEQQSADFSKETLGLFDYIIANCQAILNEGTSTKLIIRLGNYIRINNEKIDYNKINKWLKEMQMSRVAQLAGSILISNFSFKPEEVPFVKKVDPKAATVMMQSIINRRLEKHNKGITYFEYAPLENASIILGRLRSRLEAIDE